MKKDSKKAIVILGSIGLLIAIHLYVMMKNYFVTSWMFFDEHWSYPFVRSYQTVIGLSIASYLLFVSAFFFAKKVANKTLKRSVVGIVILTGVYLFFLSGEYVVITNMEFLEPEVNGKKILRVEERFSLITIRSSEFEVPITATYPPYEDSYLLRVFNFPDGNKFSILDGFGSCLRLNDPTWSYYHLMYHQGETWKIPKEKNTNDYK